VKRRSWRRMAKVTIVLEHFPKDGDALLLDQGPASRELAVSCKPVYDGQCGQCWAGCGILTLAGTFGIELSRWVVCTTTYSDGRRGEMQSVGATLKKVVLQRLSRCRQISHAATLAREDRVELTACLHHQAQKALLLFATRGRCSNAPQAVGVSAIRGSHL